MNKWASYLLVTMTICQLLQTCGEEENVKTIIEISQPCMYIPGQ